MTTGGAGLRVAGMAATASGSTVPPIVLAVDAARAALHDAELPAESVSATIHVGVRALDRAGVRREGTGPIAATLRDELGSVHGGPAFDLMDGVYGVLSGMAVGASLIRGVGAVLVTAVDPVYADAAAVVLTGADGAAGPAVGRPGTASEPVDGIGRVRADQPIVAVVPRRTGRTGPPIVLPAGGYTASPIVALLRARVDGHAEVTVIAAGGGVPTATVRCVLG